jgi:pSer/pThr/pTyr-binding forkhead associated (FHA) protein
LLPPPARVSRSTSIPTLSVRTEDGRTFRFSRPFQIGRELDCDVRIEDTRVSRKHVIVSFGNGHWRLRDQHSGNGVFIDGRRVETASIDGSLSIRLGADGPSVLMEIETGAAATPRPSTPPGPARGETMMVARYAERYFGTAEDDEAISGRTLMIRKAYQRVQKKQRRLYAGIVTLVAMLAVGAAGYAFYGHRQILRQQAVAEDLFYAMKGLDVELANVERQLASSGGAQGRDQVKTYLERRRQMEINYDRFLSGLKLYERALTPQEQLILRVTRLFGECETAAPPEYLAEVNSYIRKWQGSSLYVRSVTHALEMGYAKRIVEEFERQDLPPQFFYLALQESAFNEVASGPPTRMGIAKGMWMFIPDTGVRYGLKIGPLKAVRQVDPNDDRQHWEKATRAAAAYIKDIYATDAQASGLLVMASYNWGEYRIINMLRSMPANPRERNFWKLLEQHHDQVPKETYDYVLSIVSAAVIGENPRLFGFALDNPLAVAESRWVVQ